MTCIFLDAEGELRIAYYCATLKKTQIISCASSPLLSHEFKMPDKIITSATKSALQSLGKAWKKLTVGSRSTFELDNRPMETPEQTTWSRPRPASRAITLNSRSAKKRKSSSTSRNEEKDHESPDQAPITTEIPNGPSVAFLHQRLQASIDSNFNLQNQNMRLLEAREQEAQATRRLHERNQALSSEKKALAAELKVAIDERNRLQAEKEKLEATVVELEKEASATQPLVGGVQDRVTTLSAQLQEQRRANDQMPSRADAQRFSHHSRRDTQPYQMNPEPLQMLNNRQPMARDIDFTQYRDQNSFLRGQLESRDNRIRELNEDLRREDYDYYKRRLR